MRVNAARRDEAEQVDLAVALLRAPERAEQRLVREEGTVLDGTADAHEVLEEDAARADREVPDLRVPHLAFGQADRRPGRAELRGRIPGHEVVEDGRSREVDGIARAGRRDPPAVEDHQRDERQPRAAHRSAARQIAANDSASSEAPPTSAPSIAGCAISSAAFSGFTEPP